jgi:hypothetical protein
MKKKGLLLIGMVFCLCVSLLGFTGTASADEYGIDDIDGLLFIDGKTGVTELSAGAGWSGLTLTGDHEFTYLGTEADHVNVLKSGQGTTLFKNWKKTWNGITNDTNAGAKTTGDFFDTAFYKDGNLKAQLDGTNNLKVYEVSGAYLNQYVTFEGQPTGWFDENYTYYVIGFNDKGDDNDYDDMVVAVRGSKIPPVPIPGAVWLLGSGLVGLVGIRRRFRKS